MCARWSEFHTPISIACFIEILQLIVWVRNVFVIAGVHTICSYACEWVFVYLSFISLYIIFLSFISAIMKLWAMIITWEFRLKSYFRPMDYVFIMPMDIWTICYTIPRMKRLKLLHTPHNIFIARRLSKLFSFEFGNIIPKHNQNHHHIRPFRSFEQTHFVNVMKYMRKLLIRAAAAFF